MPAVEYTGKAKKITDPLYRKIKHTVSEPEWPACADYIYRINHMKKEKNAVILAHNYMTPQIFHGIADITGDSLGLAREAVNTKADIIIVCGVYFMAETVKLLNPEKTVIIPDPFAGCSLADSITPEDVRALRVKHPGVPVVTYVNTSADVKAECDICCTSGNALKIVESMESDRVIFLPDRYLASYVASRSRKEIITWSGRCEVHEEFTSDEIERFRIDVPELIVMAHPECPPEVVDASDCTGSTAQMIDFIEHKKPKNILLMTECSMSDNLVPNFPNTNFIRSLKMCRNMKLITLEKVLKSLENMRPVVRVPDDTAKKAGFAVKKMLAAG